MSEVGDLEWRISELEQQLKRIGGQIGTLEVHVRKLQDSQPPRGTKNTPKESDSRADRAESGKLY